MKNLQASKALGKDQAEFLRHINLSKLVRQILMDWLGKSFLTSF